jgi:hypothetical protein
MMGNVQNCDSGECCYDKAKNFYSDGVRFETYREI